MMDARPISEQELNEKIKLYYKGDQQDWDTFDEILLQLTLYSMNQPTSIQGHMEQKFPQIDKVMTEFKKRAERREFAAVKFMLFVNFSASTSTDG